MYFPRTGIWFVFICVIGVILRLPQHETPTWLMWRFFHPHLFHYDINPLELISDATLVIRMSPQSLTMPILWPICQWVSMWGIFVLFCNNAKCSCSLVSIFIRGDRPHYYMERVSWRMGASGKVFMWKEASNNPRWFLGICWLHSVAVGMGVFRLWQLIIRGLWKHLSCPICTGC